MMYLPCDVSNLLNILAAVWHFQVKTGRLQTQLCNSGTTVIDLVIFLVFFCFHDKVEFNFKIIGGLIEFFKIDEAYLLHFILVD